MTTVTPAEIRDARAYLQKQGITTAQVKPSTFAASAKEMGKTFRETLNLLARILDGGQGQGPAPSVTKSVDRLKPENAIAGDDIEYADAKGVEG